MFVQTSPFKSGLQAYSNSATGELVLPSDDTRDLSALAMQLLRRIRRGKATATTRAE